MDAVSIASSNRLLEAFERMGLSQGEGLVSSGPSPVPEAASRAFERLMEQSETTPPDPSAGQPVETRETAFPGRNDAPRDLDAPETVRSDAVASPAGLETPLLSPSELYRLQFQVAMLRLQADTGSQVTQKTSQGLDSQLRNQS